MKSISYLIIILIINSLYLLSKEEETIEFTGSLQSKDLLTEKEFKFIANYKRSSDYKYLYLFPKNLENKINSNKAILKIYFKQITDENNIQDLNLDYLNSDFSSIDFNSGLYIKLSKLNSDKAIVFIRSYQSPYLRLYYQYTKEINFPSYYKYSNFQLNQFILEKGATEKITYTVKQEYNDYLLILSKTSLRNFEITVKYKNQDVTKDKLAYLYPNGCSVFLERKTLDDNYQDFVITINNKNDKKDEVLLLGYVHHRDNEIFPNEVVNGFQLYLEGNKDILNNLLISGNSNSKQYFTYQTFSKNLDIDFKTIGDSDKGTYTITEYNSMFPYKINFEGKMNFQFFPTPKRNSLYFQYIDYYELEIAQKSLQSLVAGIPKSMAIPSGKSMYHFLPKERNSEQLYYYLRPKNQENIYVSFEKCTSYPENCTFTGKKDNSIEVIKNIGLWYNLQRTKNELQLIYVYCEKDCSYDILMTYEEDEPLFLFPDNDYTKFISNSGKDIIALPVFEYFQTSNTESLYIDLTVISGKADLTLRYSKNGESLKCNIIKTGKKQSCIISSEEFLNNEKYFKKEIYAVIEEDKAYKNTIYNIMYGSGTSKTKLLKNNIVNTELLTVPEANKISDYTKTFIFKDNQNDFFISISTKLCQSKITIDNNEKKEAYNHFYSVTKGSHNVKIYLIKDENLCNEKFEDTAILFAFNSNGQVLLPENTLINTTTTSIISFIHLFKINENINDNSFNLEIERLGENSLSITYELKRISFYGNDNRQLYVNSSQKINAKKIRYISNKQINDICGSLNQNEVCSLKMTLYPSSSSKFSLYLKKNSLLHSINLTPQSLIGSVNTKTVQYFYIDINENKNNKLELLIKSYGQDLKYNYEVKNTKIEDEEVLPLKKEFSNTSNNHQTIIDASEFSYCNSFCRLYIGVSSQVSDENEISSLFSISYHYYKVDNNFINLPLNYFMQYTFNDLNEINYVINPIEADKFTFELYIIKQNENDDTEVIAEIPGSEIYRLSSTEGKYVKEGEAKEIKIKITKNKGNTKSTFKFRVSSIGKGNLLNGFIPMISSFEEKCLQKPCYYILDDFSLDNEETSAYFYIPEKEDSVINIKALKYNESFTDSGYDKSSNNTMKRPNWYEISNINREKDIIIKIDDNDKVTLCPSYYNKPNIVTLNYGEKRTFTLRKKKIENIILNINQPSVTKSKVKINIHSIRGNGVFKFNEEIYPLGLENAYKEDITIIIDDDKLYNIRLTAINEKNGKPDTDNENAADFVFTIEYKIDLIDQFLYEINYDKINSYKFYRKEKINEVLFYLNITKRSTKDLNMNIKVYSNLTKYDIKSYFVNYKFIQKRLNNLEIDAGLNITGEAIKTYIQGGNSNNDLLTFAKLEITSDKLQNNVKEYPFICIVFTSKGKKNNYAKFDLYPYEMNNTIPLARNQLFIQKIQSTNDIYKLFLSKSDIFYRKSVKIDFVPPLKKEYDYSIAHFNSGISDPKKSEDEFISDRKQTFGKEEITLNSLKNTNQKNIIFNIFPKDNSNIEDSFIFSYKNQKSDEEDEIYMKSTELFNITGDSKEVKYIIHAPASKNMGYTVLISRVYDFEKIKHLNINKNNYFIALYLLFSDIKPIFEKYDVLTDITIYDSKRTIANKLKKGGDLYFTAICVLEDNEREIYFAYEGIRRKIDDKNFLDDLLDYMKDHVLATVIILIVILLVLGMIINICRTERKVGRLSSVRVDVEGKLMEDKAD